MVPKTKNYCGEELILSHEYGSVGIPLQQEESPLSAPPSGLNLWTAPSESHDLREEEAAAAEAPSAESAALWAAVAANGEILRQLSAQIAGMCEGLNLPLNPQATSAADARDQESAREIEVLRQTIAELEIQATELKQQNSDLASQIANSQIRQQVTGSQADLEALSWAERKALILRQLEADTFDAEAFVAELSNAAGRSKSGAELARQAGNPQQCVQWLCERLIQLERDLVSREQEIGDLQHLLQERPAQGGPGTTAGAASIAHLLDSDELVQQERRRLQELQLQWEEKFRQNEIEASLERAKLSRERQALAARQREVDAELERLRRREHQESEKDGPRKWLSQLGLTNS